MKKMMIIDRKENILKNEALRESLRCGKRLLYYFLSSVRSKNLQNQVWWGIVYAAVEHSSGATGCSQNKIVMALGSSCATEKT